MPVDKKVLEAYVREVAGADEALATTMLTTLGANEAAASAFVGGFTRTKDYTQKTQEAATVKQQAEAMATEAAKQAAAADASIKGIMKQLADSRISAATAEARLSHVKETYGLSDEDIPSSGDLKTTVKTGVATGADGVDVAALIESKLAEQRTSIMKDFETKLLPNLNGMAMMPGIWADIEAEHKELTGKRMTQAERQELVKTAQSSNTSLVAAWENKYDIGDARQKARDAANRAKWEQEWQDKQTKERSDAAIAGVTGRRDAPATLSTSPVFGKKFGQTEQTQQEAAGSGSGSGSGQQQQPVQNQPRLTGAERAATTWLERRSNNVPLGAPSPAAKTA